MKIAEYLNIYNIKQSDFAKNIGISRAHICLIIKGERRPSITLAKKMEKISNGKISALEILGLVDSKENSGNKKIK